VAIEPVAVGRKAGLLEFRLNVDNPTVSTRVRRVPPGGRRRARWEGQAWTRTIQVPATTLDALLARYGMPAFIKIDVEAPAEALAGLTRPSAALSFEFTTIQRRRGGGLHERRARRAIPASNAMPARAMLSCTADWVSADEIAAWLCALPQSANSGDIYALLRERATSPVSRRGTPG
jgi:hypothetical protein